MRIASWILRVCMYARACSVAHGECSPIDLMKRKEAIVLREERATLSRERVSIYPCSFTSILPLACLMGLDSKQREEAGTSCQEEERTCKITRRSFGARERSRYAPPPAVVRP